MSIMTFLKSIIKFLDCPNPPPDPPCSCGGINWDIGYETRDDRWGGVGYGQVVNVRVGTCKDCGRTFDLN